MHTGLVEAQLCRWWEWRFSLQNPRNRSVAGRILNLPRNHRLKRVGGSRPSGVFPTGFRLQGAPCLSPSDELGRICHRRKSLYRHFAVTQGPGPHLPVTPFGRLVGKRCLTRCGLYRAAFKPGAFRQRARRPRTRQRQTDSDYRSSSGLTNFAARSAPEPARFSHLPSGRRRHGDVYFVWISPRPPGPTRQLCPVLRGW